MAKSSKTSSLVPLIITVLIAIVAAAVAYVVWAIVTSISDTTSKKMEKHNISMSRDGMRVGVKEVSNERYADKTQSVLMKVWDNASWPSYYSRLGWGQSKEQKGSSSSSGRSSGIDSRKPLSRHSSSQQNVKKA